MGDDRGEGTVQRLHSSNDIIERHVRDPNYCSQRGARKGATHLSVARAKRAPGQAMWSAEGRQAFDD
jgi:hypothetical protein